MMSERERLACLRILCEVAAADGLLHPEERAALAEAVREAELSELTLEQLLAQPIDLEDELAALGSEQARQLTYESAVALAHIDDACTAEEEVLLRRIESALGIELEKKDLVDRVVTEFEDTVLPSHIEKIDDPIHRTREIDEDALKYAIIAAVLGAFPIPGVAVATDLGVTALQTKLVRDVAQYFGRSLDRKQAAELLAGAGLGMGMRIALSNLAKLVPGWGSALGAASAFISTYALATVATRYFEVGGFGHDTFRSEFAKAQAGAKDAFDNQKQAIEKKHAEAGASLEALAKELAQGQLSRAEYEEKVAQLR